MNGTYVPRLEGLKMWVCMKLTKVQMEVNHGTRLYQQNADISMTLCNFYIIISFSFFFFLFLTDNHMIQKEILLRFLYAFPKEHDKHTSKIQA